MSHAQCSYRLQIAADADSVFLARVAGLLASLSLVPETFQLQCDGASAGKITLALVLADATARQIDLLERKLWQMTQVVSVDSGPSDAPCFQIAPEDSNWG